MPTPTSVKGHPTHPMLIPLPIGLWVFALVADAAYRLGEHSAAWLTVAFYCIVGGVVGALLAAHPGFVDLFSIHEPATRNVGLTHMALNLLAVLVFAFNGYQRWRTPDHSGHAWLTLVGIVIIGVSGWLGGDLVYKRHVGIDMHPEGRRQPGPERR
jgi:uncharacterized membrane protein